MAINAFITEELESDLKKDQETIQTSEASIKDLKLAIATLQQELNDTKVTKKKSGIKWLAWFLHVFHDLDPIWWHQGALKGGDWADASIQPGDTWAGGLA